MGRSSRAADPHSPGRECVHPCPKSQLLLKVRKKLQVLGKTVTKDKLTAAESLWACGQAGSLRKKADSSVTAGLELGRRPAHQGSHRDGLS